MPKICAHENCRNFVFSDGYCQRHQYESTKHMERQKAKRQKKKDEGNAQRQQKPVNNNTKFKNGQRKSRFQQESECREFKNKAVPEEYGLGPLMRRCDYLFSRYIRQKGKDKDNMATCYTCGHKAHWKKLQAGHFVPRVTYALRWDEFNVRIQCVNCNEFKEGNLMVFSTKLMKENPEEMARILKQKRELFKLTRNGLFELMNDLTDKLKANNYSYI